MKKVLNILFILFCGCMNAQSTLTAISSIPLIGDSYIKVKDDSLQPGNSGANVTWNFPLLNIAPVTTINCVSINSNTSYVAWSSASIALVENGMSRFCSTSATKLSYYGSKGPNPNLQGLIHSDPEEVLHFPFTYLDSFSDSWIGTTDYPGNVVHQVGTNTVTADGYGTLIMPSGTFSNVIRIHKVSMWKDTLQFPSYYSSSVGHYYAWYSPSYRYPVLEYWKNVSNPFGIQYAYNMLVSQSVGIKMEHISADAFYYKRSADGLIVVTNNSGAFKLLLFDIQGKKIDDVLFLNNKAEIKNLNDQLYLVVVVDKNGNYLQIKKIL